MADFLNHQKELYPELAEDYDNFSNLYSQRLWHQLSVAIEAFLLISSNNRGTNFSELYFQFITKFEARLSQMCVARLVSRIGHLSYPPTEAIEFFCIVLKNRERLGVEASMCLDIDVTEMQLKLGQLSAAKTYISDTKDQLQQLNLTDATVFSKFYKVMAEYHKIVGTAQEFYGAVLMYLAYTPVEDFSDEEKYVLATDMAIAAVVGEMVYNFGEVVATPILSCLKDTPNQWIYDLVIAVHEGDIDKFNTVVSAESSQYSSQPALVRDHEAIKQKVVLIALMNLVYDKPAHERTIEYAEIARVVRIPLDQVDWVLMRALSLGLIKGKVNEVRQSVNVTWVQPKVLSMKQVSEMQSAMLNWADKVKTALSFVSDQTAEIFA